MTALYMDGFDHYGTGAASALNMLAGSWAFVNQTTCSVPSWGPRTGQYCLSANGFGPSGARYALNTPSTHYFVSFGYSVPILSSGECFPIIFRDNGAGAILYLNVLSNGQIQVKNSANTVIGTTAHPVIVAENWHFFECEINTSAHTFVLRIDDPSGGDTPVLSISDSSITGTIALIGFLEGTGGTEGYCDDVFIRDAGGSENNSWLGDRRVATLLVDADTATAGWTPNYYQKIGTGILNNTATSAGVSAASATNLNLGSGDFTIETFHRFQALPSSSNKAVILGKWNDTANQRSYQLYLGSIALNGGSIGFRTSTDGTNSTVVDKITYPWTPDLDTWYHIALVRSSGNLLLFVNGQQFGLPIADSDTYFAGTAALGLGGQAESGIVAGTSLQGWFDETRLTVGFARYTTNFTPTSVAFPRGVSDPQWADVMLLCGFDTVIQDESGIGRTLTANNGSVQQTVNDGPTVGAYSTIGKAVPDDNTFISAPYVAATGILTVTVKPTNTSTVTVGTKDGSTPAVYTFKTSISTAFDVLIDTDIQSTLQNLYNAINAGPGAGTKYGTSTTSNFDVFATQLPAGQMQVTANIPGTGGNSIASTETLASGSWGGTTLSGGLDIPGPSNFKVQGLPPTTTLVSAIQLTVRASKSDAGLGSINSAFVGPLGGVSTSTTHNLTISSSYYNDVHELDPDTSGPISPTTIRNGAFQINRDT